MKKVSEIQQGILNHIYQKLDTLQKTELKVQPYLPDKLQNHCRLANFENGVLVFAVSSGAWGTKLSYCLPDLLTTLRTIAGFPELASIRYYIEPEFDKLFSS